jgi:phosphodiesterase/alkaline phosphatase D-like protein
MVNQVFSFYFNSYLRQWSQPLYTSALATIPHLMTWDDHDIFDGWGRCGYHAAGQQSRG